MSYKPLTFIIYKENDGYVAKCKGLCTVDQGETPEEAMNRVLEATRIYLEATKTPCTYTEEIIMPEQLVEIRSITVEREDKTITVSYMPLYGVEPKLQVDTLRFKSYTPVPETPEIRLEGIDYSYTGLTPEILEKYLPIDNRHYWCVEDGIIIYELGATPPPSGDFMSPLYY